MIRNLLNYLQRLLCEPPLLLNIYISMWNFTNINLNYWDSGLCCLDFPLRFGCVRLCCCDTPSKCNLAIVAERLAVFFCGLSLSRFLLLLRFIICIKIIIICVGDRYCPPPHDSGGVAILKFETASTAPYSLAAAHWKGANFCECGHLFGKGVATAAGAGACGGCGGCAFTPTSCPDADEVEPPYVD